KTKSKGLAYMYKQKLENILKKEIEKETDRYFKDFYDRVKSCVDEIKVDRTKKEEEKPMLMNLSCLLAKEKSKTLGGELDKIDQMPEFSVRFTGPWPPYSFV
ncbi:GvpL/GvpF family gas vesicle protein, partial [bacterium]|nr:GvpL/GvpF family gas vesicle protein [bacterium]